MAQADWWKKGVIYQIYPRSFQDTNGDGIGDLEGIRSRLAYLTWLGVDAVWISPIYPSPMADFGYDISDYCNIDPVFGTLEDFDRLIAEAHGRGIKVILDFVPNHTSDQHPWFKESRSARDNPRRNWYIWRDARPDGGPPNNWISNFGGSAWEWDEHTGQYYYHAFLRQQPDLNWRNPDVRAAMYDVLRFWMNRGVDGFRVDVIWHLMKDPDFQDNPPNPAYHPEQPEIEKLLQIHSADHPDIMKVIAEMRRVTDSCPDRVLIGEIYLPLQRLVAYYGEDLSGAQLPFNFQLLQTRWDARTIASLIAEYETALPQGGWPNWVLSNHDKPRIAARVGEAQARVAAMLLLTLRGTPTLYYGDEIGLAHVHIPPDCVQDPWEKNEPGLGLNRDPERTPMQWDISPCAGFTGGRPWLPLADNWQHCNVDVMAKDPLSILALYKKLIQLRREHPALNIGHYAPSDIASTDDVLAYDRSADDGRRLTIVLNFGASAHAVALPKKASIALSTHGDRTSEKIQGEFLLRPNEGLILVPEPG